mgnify:CR=1 FL=1
MGKAEISLTAEIDEDGLYGHELEAEIRDRLDDVFDDTEDVTVYTL